MEAKSPEGRGEELHLRPGSPTQHYRARVVLLAVDERMGLSIMPLLRGIVARDGRTAPTDIAREVATALKEGGVLARDTRAGVQNPGDAVLRKLLERHWKRIEWEPPRL